jgi:hypothetical protein
MSEPEVVEPSEQELEDAFNSADEPDDSKKIVEVEKPVEVEATKDDAPAPNLEVEKPEVKAVPQMLSVPAEEYNQLVTTVVRLNDLYGEHGKKFDQAFGKIGGMEDFVKRLQKDTPTGEALSLTDEDMAELSEEFPSIATGMKTALNKVLSRSKGTGSSALDDNKINEILKPILDQERANNQFALVQERTKIKQDMQREQVLDVHPDFDAVRQTEDFQAYLAKLPKDVADTWKPRIIIETVTNYKASKVKPAPQKNARSEALAAAVNPKGSGPAMKGKSEQSLDDAFDEGFKGR